MRPPRVAVVGHVEWADFLVVPRLPLPGEILHVTGAHEGAGGGGAMTARAVTALAGSCTFVTALGRDARADAALAELEGLGMDVRAQRVARPQRRVVTFLVEDGDRTIVVVGERLVPSGARALDGDAAGGPTGGGASGRWAPSGGDLPDLSPYDAVFLTGGDAAAVRAARAARVLVATPRAGAALVEAEVELDVVVGSAADPGEAVPEELHARARWVVLTEGARGGRFERGGAAAAPGLLCDAPGRWDAVALERPAVDAYGCGDAFAAGLTSALAAGAALPDACALGARCGAAVLGERAPAVGDLARLLT